MRAVSLALLVICSTAPARAETEVETPSRVELAVHESLLLRTADDVTRVSIADPAVADVDLVTPRQVLVLAKANPGATSLVLWYGDDAAEAFHVRVSPPSDLAERVQEAVARLAPEAGVRVSATDAGVLLDGEVESAELLDRVVQIAESHGGRVANLVHLRGDQQVQLDVQMAEVSRSALKRMGLGVLVAGSGSTVGVIPSGAALGSAPRTAVVGDETVALLDTTTLAAEPFASAFQVAIHALDDDVFGILSLLKGQGLARLLANPSLVALSGQEATFLVGGEFPVPVAGDEGAVSIQFREFGTRLRFVPTVVERDAVSLRVEPEVSNLDFGAGTVSAGVAVPGLRTRRGATTLRLRDGQTFVMAGLLQESTIAVESKLPLLGDLPWLGTLFTSKELQREETELVIAVKTHLVRPLEPGEVPPLPGADAPPPADDLDFFLRNRVEGEAEPLPAGPPSFTGPVGYSR
jgi:pilus assembly protein CpaC